MSFFQGALFSLGDVHASQGDTEFTGTAAETTATVRLRLELIKGKRSGWMRIEKPHSLVAIHANRPLEVAVESATVQLMAWLIEEFGSDRRLDKIVAVIGDVLLVEEVADRRGIGLECLRDVVDDQAHGDGGMAVEPGARGCFAGLCSQLGVRERTDREDERKRTCADDCDR